MYRLLPLLFLSPALLAAAEAPTPQQLEFFEKKIRPVLVKHCYKCHSEKASKADDLKGGLQLDNRAATLKGGESGPAIVPGKPDESILLEALNYESFEMPPKGKLPATVIADFRNWIARGAPDPRDGVVATTAGIDITAGKKHWAYRPLRLPSVPAGLKVLRLRDPFRLADCESVSRGAESMGAQIPRPPITDFAQHVARRDSELHTHSLMDHQHNPVDYRAQRYWRRFPKYPRRTP